MKPPVDAPTSRQSRPAGSTPSRSSPCASFSPPRETYGGAALDAQLGVLVDLLARLVVAGHEAGHDERLRLRARLREPALDEEHVDPLLHRAGVTRGADGEPVDDVAQHARVGVDLAERRARPVGRLVGEPARAVDAVRDDVAVAVEDVVDDLEEQPELGAERAPRRPARASGTRATQSASADRRLEEAARLQPVQRRLVGRGAGDVEVLAADHPERRAARARARRAACRTTSRAGTPRRGARRPRGCRRPRRTASTSTAARAAPRRCRATAGRRARARTCARARARSPPASASSGSAPAASAVARQITGRTRLPPTVIE